MVRLPVHLPVVRRECAAHRQIPLVVVVVQEPALLGQPAPVAPVVRQSAGRSRSGITIDLFGATVNTTVRPDLSTSRANRASRPMARPNDPPSWQ